MQDSWGYNPIGVALRLLVFISFGAGGKRGRVWNDAPKSNKKRLTFPPFRFFSLPFFSAFLSEWSVVSSLSSLATSLSSTSLSDIDWPAELSSVQHQRSSSLSPLIHRPTTRTCFLVSCSEQQVSSNRREGLPFLTSKTDRLVSSPSGVSMMFVSSQVAMLSSVPSKHAG